jgi:hypothetical protein
VISGVEWERKVNEACRVLRLAVKSHHRSACHQRLLWLALLMRSGDVARREGGA